MTSSLWSIASKLKLLLCGSREYPHPPKGGYWKFESEGSLKIFKGRYEPKLQLPFGGGGGGGEGGGGEGKELFKQKPLCRSGIDIFSLICSSNWALPGNIDIHSKKGWPLRGRGV